MINILYENTDKLLLFTLSSFTASVAFNKLFLQRYRNTITDMYNATVLGGSVRIMFSLSYLIYKSLK